MVRSTTPDLGGRAGERPAGQDGNRGHFAEENVGCVEHNSMEGSESSTAREAGDRASARAAVGALHPTRGDQGAFDPRLTAVGAHQRARDLRLLVGCLNDQSALLTLESIDRHGRSEWFPAPAIRERSHRVSACGEVFVARSVQRFGARRV